MSLCVSKSPQWWDVYYRETYDAADGPRRARRRMTRLIESLPAVDRGFLTSGRVLIAHLGCAFGDGVDALAAAFPNARVLGLDCSSVAIAEAKQRYAGRRCELRVEGPADDAYDVIVNTDYWAAAADLSATLTRHVAGCRQFYVALAPCDAEPGDEPDGVYFSEADFPEQIGRFERVVCSRISASACDALGAKLLLIYASPEYAQERGRRDGRIVEQEKWDALYREMPLADENKCIQEFNGEFAGIMRQLLDDGARVLEAGAGGGWQSLALARLGRYDVHLMDFSHEALTYSRRLFERAGVSASFHYGDAYDPGSPEYDLVFNAGVLEHYPFDDQVRLIKGMASRSRKYVLVLVPNRLCYWYWLWRIQVQGHDQWPFGREAPLADLSEVFEAAGLQFVGQMFTAESWTEAFIEQATVAAGKFTRQLLEIHRSPVIPSAAKGYLLAALGSVKPGADPPGRWQRFAWKERTSESELYAAVGDALALRAATEQQLERVRDELTAREVDVEDLRHQLARSERQVSTLDAKLKQLYEGLETPGQPHGEGAAAAAAAELITKSETLKVVIQRRDDTISDLRTQLRELEKTAAALRDEVDNRSRKNIELRARLDKTEHRVNELRSWTETLNVRFNEKAMECEELAARMGHLGDTAAWKLLDLIFRVRYAAAPRGSRRDRLVKYGMHAQRRLRFHARHGPTALMRALARAARRGVRRAIGVGGGGPLHGGLELTRLAHDDASALETPGLVSVVLPVYNQADLLAESIDSVLAQTYTDFELIVVNDGSTDGVEAVLAQYAEHPKVRLLTQANQKLPKSLSNGFNLARGEFLTWTSADNLMEPRQLEKQVAFLLANPDAAMVYADYLAIDDRGEPLRDLSFRAHNRRTPDAPEIRLPRTTDGLNTRDDNFIGPCFMYRGWVGRLLGDYAPTMGVEDYDYWMRVNELFNVRHLGTDDVLYRYRVHDNTLCAHAAEHRIAENVQHLMVRQRERHEFSERPWVVYIDAATQQWARKVDVGRHELRKLDDLREAPASDEKRLVLIHYGAIRQAAELAPALRPTVAVWFSDDAPSAPYECNGDLATWVDACFCGDGTMLARLGLFTRQAYLAAPGQTLFDLALAHANSNVFRRDTTPAESSTRHLPTTFTPGDRRTRVLLQADNFVQGGFEQVVLDVASVLDPEQFDVSILVVGDEGPAVHKAQRLGLSVLRLPPGDREEAYRRLLIENHIDVINPHYSVFGAAIAADLGIPYLQTIHSTYIWLTNEQIAEHRAADPYTTAYLCVSSAAASYADLRFGFSPAKMVIVPNGVDAEAFEAVRAGLNREQERGMLGFGDEHFVLLEVASIYPPKGQLLLIQALAEAMKTHPNLRVALLGRPMDERYTHQVREEARRLGVEHAVRFLGYQDGAQKFYCLCDAFALPSFCEGWSLALAEALYAGLPTIATNVGSAGDLLRVAGGELLDPPFRSIVELDQDTLYRLVDQKHPELVAALAKAMTNIATDPQPPAFTEKQRRALDRRVAYEAYASIFKWSAMGGDPTATKPWVWELHGRGI